MPALDEGVLGWECISNCILSHPAQSLSRSSFSGLPTNQNHRDWGPGLGSRKSCLAGLELSAPHVPEAILAQALCRVALYQEALGLELASGIMTFPHRVPGTGKLIKSMNLFRFFLKGKNTLHNHSY